MFTKNIRLFLNCEISNRQYLLLFVIALFLVGCSSSRQLETKFHNSVYASLGIEEGRKDNFTLYKEASSWLKTLHVEGGLTHNGIDCSGLVYLVYKNVYGKTLERNSTNMMNINCKKIRMKRLKEGDLVFFNTGAKKKSGVNHVGIYLKDNKFVHTSTSKGVMISSLDEKYYLKAWICGGRVR